MSDYFVLMCLVLIYFPIHREFWDDPRLPTLTSLRKKGYKPEVFWKFGEERGISEVDKIISEKDLLEVLDNFSKKINNK